MTEDRERTWNASSQFARCARFQFLVSESVVAAGNLATGLRPPVEDESTVDTHDREEVDRMKVHRFEPDDGTGHPGAVLVGYPRAEVEARRDLAWCFDYDRTDNVPEMHRKDGYIYVPADEWDRRVTGNID